MKTGMNIEKEISHFIGHIKQPNTGYLFILRVFMNYDLLVKRYFGGVDMGSNNINQKHVSSKFGTVFTRHYFQ